MADDESDEEQEQDFGEEELQEIEEAFNIYAKVKEPIDEHALGPQGILPTHDLGYAMKQIGFDPTEAEVFTMLDEVDPNGTGFINFKTFIFLLKKHVKVLKEEELRIAFAVFDRDGNGHIGTSEIKYVTRNLGERYTDDEIEDMFKEVDADGDGKINFEDFSYFMTKR
ncbi:hypothetical protein HHI36_012409 [Cryptolaemus montrouzieri]|uniref:EF-hand domain-containing protein n=1 Tax=Cryptolaemus montrouzieri TaxID=559131 RepID=A0ABD2NE42_9CUCU